MKTLEDYLKHYYNIYVIDTVVAIEDYKASNKRLLKHYTLHPEHFQNLVSAFENYRVPIESRLLKFDPKIHNKDMFVAYEFRFIPKFVYEYGRNILNNNIKI